MGQAAAVITIVILVVGVAGVWFGWKVGHAYGYEDGVLAERERILRRRRTTSTDEREHPARPGAVGRARISTIDFRDLADDPDEE